ncbi:MAG TPA: hypothetical protein PLW02_09965, partial [Verrucomicrobiota bacterium]|nr:hypothetical protein [Verrucomicrobiota bacterium]
MKNSYYTKLKYPIFIFVLSVLGLFANVCRSQPFYLPTPNTEIFNWRNPEKYYVPTPGKRWETGTFGCVR